MSNLNKIYHKGRFRSGEWSKHLRPYLKRMGNKKFRRTAAVLVQDESQRQGSFHKKKTKRKIKAKITIRFSNDRTYSYFRSYRTMRDLENAVKRPNVVRYMIIGDEIKNQEEG